MLIVLDFELRLVHAVIYCALEDWKMRLTMSVGQPSESLVVGVVEEFTSEDETKGGQSCR